MVDVSQARDLSDGGPIAPELIGVNHLWDIIFSQESRHRGLRGLGVSVPLKENVEHETVLVDRSPEPVSDAIDTRTHFVQMPAGTPSGFPLTKFVGELRAEFDAPLAQGFVTDLDAALV